MPVECFYSVFSQKSDVWPFGITAWEIFTLAKNQCHVRQQVIDDAIKSKNHKLLAKPDMCPPEIYSMLICWVHDFSHQTTFDQLSPLLTSIQYLYYHNYSFVFHWLNNEQYNYIDIITLWLSCTCTAPNTYHIDLN